MDCARSTEIMYCTAENKDSGKASSDKSGTRADGEAKTEVTCRTCSENAGATKKNHIVRHEREAHREQRDIAEHDDQNREADHDVDQMRGADSDTKPGR